MSVFGSPEELARGAAEEWLNRLSARSPGPVYVALPGGRIYRLFYQALTDEAGKKRALLDQVHFFWGDERCVPPEDPESNFNLAETLLFQPLGISPSQVHRIRGEDDPSSAAAAAASELLSVAPVNPGGLPLFDYVFLGMGEDGHVASLFPGDSMQRGKPPHIYRAVTGPKPPPRRITLNYSTIAAAENVWVLISGSGKEGALRQSISPGGVTPLAKVLSSRKESLVLTDIRLV